MFPLDCGVFLILFVLGVSFILEHSYNKAKLNTAEKKIDQGGNHTSRAISHFSWLYKSSLLGTYAQVNGANTEAVSELTYQPPLCVSMVSFEDYP